MKSRDEDELHRYVGCVYQFEPSKPLKINAFLNKHTSFFSWCTFWADPSLCSKNN